MIPRKSLKKFGQQKVKIIVNGEKKVEKLSDSFSMLVEHHKKKVEEGDPSYINATIPKGYLYNVKRDVTINVKNPKQ